MKALDKLANGAVVLARQTDVRSWGKPGEFVLAYFHNQFVTWWVDEELNAHWGHYDFEPESIVDDYYDRAGINASPTHRANLLQFIQHQLGRAEA
tara:strand:- start:1282 stop:1566 length:285 start_codon:yes stop_codon:yes gene_type:complete